MTRNIIPSRASRGMGLVELLVGLALGLVLVLALAYFFLSSSQTGRTHSDSSRMQENARFSLDVMGKAIRQAGYRTDYLTVAAFDPLTASEGGNDDKTPDSITVRYDAQDGGEVDCAGTNIVPPGVVTYALSVNADRELICSNGTVSVVLADNVENLQITYGVDTGRNGTIDSYSKADALTVTTVREVAVVNVVLTMRGATPNAASTVTAGTTNKLGYANDGFLRQTYNASYTVRNQAG